MPTAALKDVAGPRPLFPMGRTIATPGALALMGQLHVDPVALLRRHQFGDFGDLDPEDIERNRWAADNGARVFSQYDIGPGARIWIITEAKRQVTTIHLPSEY